MKQLYREVARRIHPDLTSEQDDRVKRQQLMADANEAYERGDGGQLSKILAEYEHRPEAILGDDAGAALIRAIRKISRAKNRMAEIESAIQELMRSDLYHLKVRVDQAEQHGHDILSEMTGKVEKQIAQALRYLNLPGPDAA
jgi:MoxR-like ATPase